MSFLFFCCNKKGEQNQYQIQTTTPNSKISFVSKVSDIKDWNNTGSVLRVKRSEYDQLMEKYSKGAKWTDGIFGPGGKSLGEIRGIPKNSDWKRIGQIVGRPQVFASGLDPQDVRKGSLKNCYLLSALSALSQPGHIHHISKLFENQVYNNAGIYKVTLRIDGIIQEILVDDFIPVNKLNVPYFCQPKNNEIWTMILQKAYAKAHGSYAQINSGSPSDVFKAITYAPSQLRPIKQTPESTDKLWNDLLISKHNKNPMCCSTANKQQIRWENIGLTQGHTYTIIDLGQVTNKDGGFGRIVKLRDPWEFQKWKGKGNQGDSEFWARVKEEDRTKFLKQSNPHGIFTIEFGDFCKYFSEVHFCYVVDRPIYEHEPLYSDKKHGSLYILQVQNESDYIIQLHQSTKGTQNRYQGLSRTTLLISKFLNYEFVDGSLKYQEEDNSMKVHLTPGKYFLYAKVDPALKTLLLPELMSISSYSNHYVDIVLEDKKKHSNFWQKVFISYARNNRRKQFHNGLLWISWKLFLQKGGFAYLAFGVDSQSDKKFVLTINEKDFEDMGYVLKKPHKRKGKQIIEVKPGFEEIIVARVKNSPLQKMKFPPEIDIQIV